MTKPSHQPRSLRGTLLVAIATAFAMLLTAATTEAQPTRRNSPLRTPSRIVKKGTKKPAAPKAGTTGGKAPAKPGAGEAGAAGKGAPSKVGSSPDIEYRGTPPGGRVNFNMNEADLLDLVKTVSQFTGRRFIFGGKLRAIKATVVSPRDVSSHEAYLAFLSVLDSHGMTVIPHGRYLKIVESAGVATKTTQILGTAEPVPYVDRFITRLYRLKHTDATDVSTVLTKFKSKDGDITVYAPSNLLIITDTGTNIRRLLRIVEELDAGGAGEQIYMQPLHYTTASDLAATLTDMLDLGQGGGKARVIAEERNNALVIIATDGDYQRVLELVKRIDVPASGEGQIHVLPLQHAQCVELQTTLSQILGGGGGAAAAARTTQPQSRAARRRTQAAAAASTAGSADAGIFEGEIRVNCDEATNSLVTVSSLRDYAQLRNVIDKLDQPRRQVFLEAVIMDVNVDHTTDLGLAFHGGGTADLGGGGDTIFYGGSNPAQSLTGLPQSLEALAFGVRGPDLEGTSQLTGTGISIPGFGIVLHALATKGDSNLLATPHILATDNIKAEISIGQNIPLQTNVGGGLSSLAGLAGGQQGAGGLGSLAGLAGGFGMGFQAPRQDVGIKLSITPHINDSDQVRMEIIEEFSTAGAPQGDLGAIPINKRTADTTIIVKDQQTVVIGGLTREEMINAETKIPVLGDIPVLGMLFRSSNQQARKVNLLLILTPHIVREQADLRRIFERKMQERQEFLDRYFVFEDSLPWEPVGDYTRTNGMLEHIRQTQLKLAERERLAKELEPDERKIHNTVTPIPLPSMAGAKPQPKASARKTPAKKPAARKKRTTRTPAKRNLRVPGSRRAPNRYRVE